MKRPRDFFRTVLLIASLSLAFISCRSTKFAEGQTQTLENGLEINAQDNVFKIYDTDFENDFNEGDKFIFLRLYFPNYKNKLSGVNILKALIISIDPTDEKVSHCSMAFNLHDEFFGLTRYRPQHLKSESCTDTSTNRYMKKCDIYHSIQTTLALKVSEEEYQNTKTQLEDDYKNGNENVRYVVSKNLVAGAAGLKRKHQKTPEGKAFGGLPSKKGYINPEDETKQKFVCSSYLAYLLVKNVQSIRDFFIEKQINYFDVIPTDFLFMPGMEKLFSSTWVDYKIAAEEFVKLEPLFKDYLY